ncbi:hypothetical protein GGI07_004705 [Coemansia sp. Benny D115]|nr:hypothetical protein GGI07_004705 [Coemansia sp. Benny D115]
MSGSTCRFYEAEFPEIGDIVMVKIISIKEIGAYVQLEEYGNVEGMVPVSELSRKRIRSIQSHIRIGRREPVAVSRVDTSKGYIDLSKSKVRHDEVLACEEKFKNSKRVHLIITTVANKLDKEPQELYEQFGWPLYKKYGHALEGFKAALVNPQEVLGEYNLDERTMSELMAAIGRQLTPQRIKLRADIEVACTGYAGVEAIRRALKAGEAVSTEGTPIKIRLIAPPLYTMSATTVDKNKDLQLMEQAVEEVRRVITEEGGSMKVVMGPKSVSETEEKDLQDQMDRAERENTQVAGDDESDDDY